MPANALSTRRLYRTGVISALLSNIASVLAGEYIKSYRLEVPFKTQLDLWEIFVFASTSFTLTPIAVWFNLKIDDMLPSYYNITKLKIIEHEKEKVSGDDKTDDIPDLETSRKFSIGNIILKVAFSETVWSIIFNTIFQIYLGVFDGNNKQQVLERVKELVPTIWRTSVKVWPFVTLLRFTVIPVDYRDVVGSIVAFIWGIYISLLSS